MRECPLRHNARDKWDVLEIQLVCQALYADGLRERIGNDDFFPAERGGVTVVGGFGIGLEHVTYPGKASKELQRVGVCDAQKIPFVKFGRSTVCEAFSDFGFQTRQHPLQQQRGLRFDFRGANQLYIEKPGKQQREQIPRDRRNDALGGEILPIEMIDAAHLGVGVYQSVG